VLIIKNHKKSYLPSIKWDSSFCCILFKLVVGTSSKSVSADQTGFPILFHVVIGQLGTCGGFSRTLQTYKHDDIRTSSNWLEWLDSGVNELEPNSKFSKLFLHSNILIIKSSSMTNNQNQSCHLQYFDWFKIPPQTK